jgi:hypothetical protein
MKSFLRWLASLLCVSCAFGEQRPPARSQPSEMERAVEEFRSQTQQLGIRPESPQNGRRAGGPKRQWHGRLFENFRNDFLDAVPHQIRQRGETKSLLRRNQFGFNVAGPVVIPRLVSGNNTYFSLSFEGVRERVSRTYLRTIPTVAERGGDYSAVVDQAGQVLPIFDPKTTRPNPAYDSSQAVSVNNLQYFRDPFPQNRIPADRLDPAAVKAVAFYPAPNVEVGPFFQNNYFINSPETNTATGMIAKVDKSFGGSQRLTTELAFSNGFLGAAHWFPTDANPGPSDQNFQTHRGMLEHILTASAQTVNTASFEASSQVSRSGDTQLTPFPDYNFKPYLGMGRSYPVASNARNTYVWSDSISTRYGQHSLRATGQYVRYQVNSFWPAYPSGYFRFSPGLTSLPGIVNTGHAFASFLLGLPEYAATSVVTSPSYFRRDNASLALRDQYEARKGLSVTVGLNISRHTPRTEKFDRQSTIDLEAINPANARPGALVAAGRNGVSRGFRPALVRFDPSVSIAWNPLGNATTVVRAAYARSYTPIPTYSGQWGTQGFNGYQTFISPNVQLEPAVILSAGLPPPANPLPDLRPDAVNNTVADLIDATSREPLYQSASLTIERELPGSMVVSVGASYAGGRNLVVSDSAANPNAIAPAALRFRDRLNDENFNASLRPYPQYKGFDVYSSYPIGRYQRDAGFLRLEKRASKGLSLSAYYVFSKQLDDYSGPYGAQDFFNRQNEWALNANSQPQRLQFSYVYELPLGSDKPFFEFSGWRRYLVDGWSLSGTAAIASGTPLALRPEFNNTGGVISALNVNVVPGVDPNVSDRGPSLWFNPAAFDQPPDFTMGNASRTSPALRNPGRQNFDLSVSKRVAVSPERAVEFSAAAFDVLNHADWNDPDTVIGPPSAPNVNAGKIIGSHGGRVIQMGVRFSF